MALGVVAVVSLLVWSVLIGHSRELALPGNQGEPRLDDLVRTAADAEETARAQGSDKTGCIVNGRYVAPGTHFEFEWWCLYFTHCYCFADQQYDCKLTQYICADKTS